MSDINSIAKAFVDYYYSTFDKGRADLFPLYVGTSQKAQSMLSFEGQQFSGAQAIVEKLTTLPFQAVRHQVVTTDAQPTTSPASIIVMVTGRLLVDEEQNPQQFSQTFHLVQDGTSYFVLNDIFRLVYGF